MAVLPENMDRLNPDDVRSSLSIIENYIRYMGERIEFSMRNVTKTVSAAGVSSAEMYVLVTAMGNSLSALQSTVNGLNGTITTLSGQVSTLQGAVGGLSEQITDLQGQITALELRVAALEQE